MYRIQALDREDQCQVKLLLLNAYPIFFLYVWCFHMCEHSKLYLNTKYIYIYIYVYCKYIFHIFHLHKPSNFLGLLLRHRRRWLHHRCWSRGCSSRSRSNQLWLFDPRVFPNGKNERLGDFVGETRYIHCFFTFLREEKGNSKYLLQVVPSQMVGDCTNGRANVADKKLDLSFPFLLFFLLFQGFAKIHDLGAFWNFSPNNSERVCKDPTYNSGDTCFVWCFMFMSFLMLLVIGCSFLSFKNVIDSYSHCQLWLSHLISQLMVTNVLRN